MSVQRVWCTAGKLAEKIELLAQWQPGALSCVSSGASRIAPVILIRSATGAVICKVVPTPGSQKGRQRDTVLPGRAAARPKGGNMGPAMGHVGSATGRVMLAPRVPPGHVQAQQVCSSKCFVLMTACISCCVISCGPESLL